MPRAHEEELLEPILPKHPPTQPAEGEVPAAEAEVEVEGAGAGGRRAWDRWLLLACAVVAALSLVFVALRVNEIAEYERVQACQARAVAEQANSVTNRGAQQGFMRELADCVGIEATDRDAGDD